MLDELKLQHGEGYEFFGLKFKHPTLLDIVSLKNGYEDYQYWVSVLISESIDIADILWIDGKIWYEDIKSEWSFFLEKAISTAKEDVVKFSTDEEEIISTCLIVDNILKDALNFFLQTNGEYIIISKKDANNQIILYNCNERQDGILLCDEGSIKFTESHYYELKKYLKILNWVSSDEANQLRNCGNKRAKEFLLKQMYKKRKRKSSSNVNFSSIISSLVGNGIRYKDIWEIPIYEIYDIYYRKVKTDEYNHTMQAYYSGAIDTKKNPIRWEKINWSSIIRKYDDK